MTSRMRTRLAMALRSFLPNRAVQVRHREGVRMWINLRRQLGLAVRGAQRYEPANVARLRSLVARDAVVYDVGAQVGFYAMLFSVWVGPAGTVCAFEPDPENLDLLRRNARSAPGGPIMTVDAAVADTSAETDFLVDSVTGATGTLRVGGVENSLAHLWARRPPDRIRVRTISLDDFVYARRNPPPTLVKIDVEGCDDLVVAGMSRLLDDIRPRLFIEGPRRQGSTVQTLQSRRYRIEACEVSRDGSPYVLIAHPE
ncbi:MAG: FkbM family methyltransferase [Nitrospirae bacterium]|nr:FkbM family methyltransferase [Nitrospirota bacterium]